MAPTSRRALLAGIAATPAVAAPIAPVLAVEASPAQREALEAYIEGLIGLLDEIDGSADPEPENDDEPSLGWPEGVSARTGTGLDDREQDAGDEPEIENEHGADTGESDNGIGDRDGAAEQWGSAAFGEAVV